MTMLFMILVIIFAFLAGIFTMGIAFKIASEIKFDSYIRNHLNQNENNHEIIMSEALTDDQIKEIAESSEEKTVETI